MKLLIKILKFTYLFLILFPICFATGLWFDSQGIEYWFEKYDEYKKL